MVVIVVPRKNRSCGLFGSSVFVFVFLQIGHMTAKIAIEHIFSDPPRLSGVFESRTQTLSGGWEMARVHQATDGPLFFQ